MKPRPKKTPATTPTKPAKPKPASAMKPRQKTPKPKPAKPTPASNRRDQILTDYQLGANLRLYDIAAESDMPVPIVQDSDFDHAREKWIKDPIEFFSDAHPSPDGTRAVVTARGRVFVIPRKGGRLVEAGRKPGVRYRDARFMPDGKNLLVLSDESGEVELWIVPADGVGDPTKLTTDGVVLRRQAVPSPDGRHVVHTDKNFRLFLLNVETKENKRLSESTVEEFGDLAWSPDSKWLAFAEPGENQFRRVKLYSLATGKTTAATTDRYDSFSPAFSPDGQWLYLLSDRNLKSVVKSPWGTYQPEPFLDKKTKIYQIPLTNGLRSPFVPATEVEPAEKESKKVEGKLTDNPPDKKGIAVQLDGIATRLIPVPVSPGDYRSLALTEKALFWLASNRHRHADLGRRNLAHLQQHAAGQGNRLGRGVRRVRSGRNLAHRRPRRRTRHRGGQFAACDVRR
ncbi:MAG TPA: hypothetical protein VGL71_10610 [Urbifossiella sp.]